MSHSVNMAIERLIATGLPVSVSVMFPTPWYQESVDILKRHPEVSVGIHLTLNSEWKNYRWGPVAGKGTVPTLVDAEGFFFPTSKALEDNHQYFGEPRYNPQYDARPADKPDSLVALVNRLKPGYTVLVTHVGIDNAELGALLDMNTDGGLAEMSKNRQGELDAVTSQRFSDAVKAHNVKLITYRQLIAMQGLKSMKRPEEN